MAAGPSLVFLGLVVVFAVAATSTRSEEEAPAKMVYRVHHSKYGDVGSYTNSIEKKGDTTIVSTRERMKVSVLGVVAYREEFDRVEDWAGPNLMSFRGVTTKNGERTQVQGIAGHDQFTLSTPKGMVVALADVRLANPWSEAILSARTIVTPEEGNLAKVSVTGGESAQVTVNGGVVEARHYRMVFLGEPKSYEVWFDAGGVPIRFSDVSESETVTFDLTECEGAVACASYSSEKVSPH